MTARRTHRLWIAVVVCALLLGAVGPRADADDPQAPDYGTVVPATLANIVVSTAIRAQCDAAIAALADAERTATPWDAIPMWRAQLALAGDAGVRVLAEHLCNAKPTAWMRLQLVSIIAESEHPGADDLLTTATEESDAAIRMAAADGLGKARTPQAVDTLRPLLRDAAPGVRLAALRALFAIETGAARDARASAPSEAEPALQARRLGWHRRVGDRSPRVIALATQAWAHGQTAALRSEAAALLADEYCGVATPDALLEEILAELGGAPDAVRAIRTQRKLPTWGADVVADRRVAIRTLLNLLSRDGRSRAHRRTWIEQGLAWIARPVPMDAMGKEPIPEHELMRRLPEVGIEALDPTIAAIESKGFRSPHHGFQLVRQLGGQAIISWAVAYVREQVDALIPHPDRFAAACTLFSDLGSVGDEALARLLFLDPANGLHLPRWLSMGRRVGVRGDIGTALRTDPGAWVVPLLCEGLQSDDDDLEAESHRILAKRPEPAALRARVEAFFERPYVRGHDRLRSLVHRGDDRAVHVLTRAFADPRKLVISLALQQFDARATALHNRARFLPLVMQAASRLQTAHDFQSYVTALVVLAPDQAVRFVQTQWDALPNHNARTVCLQLLREVRGKSAREAAIDLALAKAGPGARTTILTAASAVLAGRFTYRLADVTAFWRRLLAKGHPRRKLAVRLVARKGVPDLTDLLLPMVDEIWKSNGMPIEDGSWEREVQVTHLVRALGFQPRDKVERLLIDAALDPLLPPATRVAAVKHLKGKISDAGRRRLMRSAGWTAAQAALAGSGAPEAAQDLPLVADGADDEADEDMQWYLAQIIGYGADEAVAQWLLKRLDKDIAAWAARQPTLAEAGRGLMKFRVAARHLGGRIKAGARAIAETRHAPTIAALLDRLFDPNVIRVSQTRAEAFASTFDWAGPGAAGRTPSHPSDLNYAHEVPAEVALEPAQAIVGQLKVLKDTELAPLMERALQRAHRRGDLARVPEIHMTLLCGTFLDRGSGACPQTARILLDAALRLPPDDSAAEMRGMGWMIDALEDRSQYAAMLPLTERVARVVQRRMLERPSGAYHRQFIAHRNALRAVVLAKQGKPDQARALFADTLARTPHDPDTLNTVAWYMYVADVDVAQAEVLARRAAEMDRRVARTVRMHIADTLASILRARGKAQEGLDLLLPLVHAAPEPYTGAYHLDLARLFVAVGNLKDAEVSLAEAIRIDRRMASRLASDPTLAPLASRLDAIVRSVESQRE